MSDLFKYLYNNDHYLCNRLCGKRYGVTKVDNHSFRSRQIISCYNNEKHGKCMSLYFDTPDGELITEIRYYENGKPLPNIYAEYLFHRSCTCIYTLINETTVTDCVVINNPGSYNYMLHHINKIPFLKNKMNILDSIKSGSVDVKSAINGYGTRNMSNISILMHNIKLTPDLLKQILLSDKPCVSFITGECINKH